MNAGFTFEDASRHLGYFSELGVSHLYLSPIWQALPGSPHGYDVIDHASISEELGGRKGFVAFSDAAHRMGLRIIADIVPNHVATAGHAWWRDVLRFGQASRYAEYFDIDWDGRGGLLPGKVLLPVLNAPLDRAIESRELNIEVDSGEPVVAYQGQRFPLSLASHPAALALLEASGTGPAPLESLEPVRQLLAEQHYQLVEWRAAPNLINYRRFFDVNGLAGLRMEHRPAFEDTHRLVAEMTAAGHIDGLRIDHVDGLYDPAAYLRDLRRLCPGVPLWVEKILAEDEALPPWPVMGTTGYDFPAAVESLFYDAAGDEQLVNKYQQFTGDEQDFETVAYESRREIATTAFKADIVALVEAFEDLAHKQERTEGISLDEIYGALLALLASFPRYRTYADAAGPSGEDRAAVGEAANSVRARKNNVSEPALSLIVDVLSGWESGRSESEQSRRRGLICRFQQLSSPLMAKGIEDTAFYRYTPFLARNEVGGNPGSAPRGAALVHGWFESRLNQPFTMNATSTHDTKRSEDARMRLAVLTEVPRDWNAAIADWSFLNRDAKQIVSGEPFPVPHTEHYLYQTLVASWERSAREDYVERIVTHMRKASREAKLWTSWLEPNERKEAALEAFIRTILSGGEFPAQLGALVERIQPAAESNSLALLALKCLAPGVPDFYQGAEDWLYTLTDPDNRRPVDFVALSERLRTRRFRSKKMHLSRRLLGLRAAHSELFAHGSYAPLSLCGPIEEHAFGFLREREDERVAVLVRRRFAGLLNVGEEPFQALAGESRIELPPLAWFDWLDPKRPVAVSDLPKMLDDQPVVVLTSFERARS